ncbi:MAG: caspase family protein [Myxococcota bacterium]
MPADDDFLIHQVHHPIGTHVLVVGVGSYPCLEGGDPARSMPNHQNLGQLDAPPRSARTIARWFVDHFHNPARPLATVALLTSEAGGAPASAATADNVERAVKQWKNRCAASPENLPIFYFCGHGLGDGGLLSLLMEDFGNDPDNALQGAVDFNRLHQGMKSCGALQQLFFIDACRTDASMLRYADGYAGRVILQPTGVAGFFQNPVYYSTLRGMPAYGRAGRLSHFADALLAAFSGTGSDDAEGDWRVDTNTLHRALGAHMQRKIDAGLASAQIAPVENLTTFEVHRLKEPPRVPVFVGCRPEQATDVGELACGPTGTTLEPVPATASNGFWELELRTGRYDFEARFSPLAPYRSQRATDCSVRPPYRRIPPLEVL